MNYLEATPSPVLAGVVKCYWSLQYQPTAELHREPVLPDGCPEMVFNLSARFRRYGLEGGSFLQPRSLISGQLSTAIHIGPTGPVDLFGIRFHPIGAYPVIGIPLDELTDRTEDAAGLIGTEESVLHEQLGSASSFANRVAVVEEYLTRRIVSSRRIPSEILYAERKLSRNGISVARLAHEIGWSQRRLERQFAVWVGLRPKMFGRVTRFRRLIHILENGGGLADASFACGFYDQAHMHHDFRHFTGSTPTQFMGTSHTISEMFVSGD